MNLSKVFLSYFLYTIRYSLNSCNVFLSYFLRTIRYSIDTSNVFLSYFLQTTGKLNELKAGIAKFLTGITQADDEAEKLDKSNLEREEEYKGRKRVLDLLPNADENIARLKQVVDSSSKRILALAAKWETRRSELMATYRKLRHAAGNADGSLRN